jgi:Zn-dependent metalloprotease
MKHILLYLFISTSLVSLGQTNLFSVRSKLPDQGLKPKVEAFTVNGRQAADEALPIKPGSIGSIQNQPDQPLKYRYKRNTHGQVIWQKVYDVQSAPGGTVNVQVDNSLTTVVNESMSDFNFGEDGDFISLGSRTDQLGMVHVRLQQTVHGIPVHGGEWIYHLANNEVLFGNGQIYENLRVSSTASVQPDQAIKIGLAEVREDHPDHQTVYEIPEAHLMIRVDEEGNAALAYRMEVRPDPLHVYDVWVDAVSGEVIEKTDLLCAIGTTAQAKDLSGTTRTISTYETGGTYYMIDASRDMFSSSSSIPSRVIGGIQTVDARNTNASTVYNITSSDNTWTDASAVSAHYNAGLSYEYFKTVHGRNSINGFGGTIVSVINVTEDDGSGLDNAYWNGRWMFYGNGRSAFEPLAGGLDVAGHELTHGVISNTANLEYKNQSGAVNESFADIFGVMIDRDDWTLGEDIVKKNVFTSGAMRSLSDPHNGGNNLGDRGYQPKKMSEFYTGSADNGGVHINSGIPNHAYYLIAVAIGKDKAEKIYYRALSEYLTSKSEFLDLRYAVEQSASDLYGATEVNEVKKAFDTVEIYDPNGGGSGNGDEPDDLPINPGAQFIVSADVNTSDQNTLYRSNTVGADFLALSQTDPARKASVTDDGSEIVFVSTSNDLYRVTVGSSVSQDKISNDKWSNAAISKDGSMIATVSTVQDSAIYVYHFDREEWREFRLYNPTYTEGVDAGGVLRADAIEFDPSGQYILYDAESVIENQDGSDYSYWDVGLLHVWDLEKDNWAGGKIEKVFTQLPEGVSIGNATFAKNSPHIIAYDYIDINSGQSSVVTRNLVTNASSTIYTGTKLGFPNYSTDDDQLIFDAYNTLNEEVVGIIDLQTDKLTRDGNPTVLIEDAKWASWYANGTRALLSDKKEITSFAFPGVSGSPEGTISNNTIEVTLPSGTDLTSLIPNFTHSVNSKVMINGTEQISGVSKVNFTNSVTYTVRAQDGSTRDYTVTANVLVGVDELDKQQMVLYPNPNSGRLHLVLDAASSVSITNVHGQVVKTMKLEPGRHLVDCSELPTGTYWVKRMSEGRQEVYRLMMQ